MYGVVTGMGGLGQIRVPRGGLRGFGRWGLGDTIADFFAPNDPTAPTYEQAASSLGTSAAALIAAVKVAIPLWGSQAGATVTAIAGQLPIGGAAAVWAARNALIQVIQSANPSLQYNTIWAAMAGQNPANSTMASVVAILPASNNSNIPDLTTAPVLSAASQAGEQALIQAENNPTPEQQAALEAMAAATDVPLSADALAQQAQMTSDINAFIASLPALPSNYMSGPIAQQPTANQIAVLPAGGGGVVTNTPYAQMPGAMSVTAAADAAVAAAQAAAAGATPASSTAAPSSSTGNWFTDDSMISGIPNWQIAGGGALLLLLLLKK